MKRVFFLWLSVLFFSANSFAQKNLVFVEAENFKNKGGWVVDQQFIDVLGTSILMAHGMGIPVADASTTVKVPATGEYRIFVRTRNWTAPWSDKDAAGKFEVSVNNKKLEKVFGTEGKDWAWHDGGVVSLKSPAANISLHDLTGFNGRVDAILLTTDLNYKPINDNQALKSFRKKALGYPENPAVKGKYDFVVVGGGWAGMCSAISAARLGLKVALIQNRPVLGGNNSAEVRVHLGGHIRVPIYKNIGNLVNEIGHTKWGNAKPAANYEDEKKMNAVLKEKNISLFMNHHVTRLTKKGAKIATVIAQNIETGKEVAFAAPLFADCTGDGTVAYLAGAKFMTGIESKSEYNESRAPEKGSKMTMGTSIQWNSKTADSVTTFPDIKWGLTFTDSTVVPLTLGDWDWETGMDKDQINDFEYVRDFGMLAVYSNWAYLKNHYKQNNRYAKRQLDWVAFIGGKRESRRIIGDYILNENDLTKPNVYPDGTASTSWTIDLHYPDPENTKKFPGMEFKSIAKHSSIYPYPIPLRCLYSKDVPNLFMAGRNISVTHVALGTVRLMRTAGMMGEVLGMAASVCKKHNATPREVYKNYFPDLKALMEKGVGDPNLPNMQKFNEGDSKYKEAH